MRVLFIAWLFVWPSWAFAEGDIVILLPNAGTCPEILKLQSVEGETPGSYRVRRNNDAEMKLVFEHKFVGGWLRGYFSAINQTVPQAKGDITGNLTSFDMMTWLYSYCRANPKSEFIDAVRELRNSLVK